MGGRRSYDGPDDGLDQSWQYWHERPAAQEEDSDGADATPGGDDGAADVVYATAPEHPGTETIVDVPMPGDDNDKTSPEQSGQTTWEDWREVP